jgi:hypothetical protein
MSKQVKLKFKKLLKKAEFVQADFEYHDELLPEAKLEFATAINEILSTLSAEDRQKVDDYKKKAFNEMVEKMKEESAEKEEEEKGGVPQQPEDIKMDEEKEATEDNEDEEDEEADKTKKLKKLFYKIADLTHPDKAIARGDSQVQTKRLEAIFRKAKEAYNDLNWYVLYSIALDLGLPVEDPTEETITWLEADIKSTLGKISEIACLVVWVWYVGDTNSKNMAIASYLQQTFDFTWTPTLEPTES